MSDKIAIKVDNVSKTFRLPHEKNNSIKGAVLNFYKRKKSYEKQQVLKDISFEIKEGEFFGIVGRNGSGKSTLLKLLAGIYSPSKGKIQVNGKLTPFIELGVGFNPELTGRENVFLNGALLGFSRSEMNKMYDEIVAFAELERFMDQKLKNYSSGMQVRLAFSIAIRAQSDILILDEVLAVGDESFQKKCIDVFESYKSQNKTVILVTHDMSTVKRFCSGALLINDGEIVVMGDSISIANNYSKLNNEIISRELESKNLDKHDNEKVKLITDTLIEYGNIVRLNIDLAKFSNKVKNVGVAVYKNTGEYVFGSNTILDKIKLEEKSTVKYSLDAKLGKGNYHFKIGLFGNTDQEVIEFIEDGPSFSIKDTDLKWEGITRLEHNWD